MKDYDVIVIGFGLAGAVAAAESMRRGATTLILDIAPPSQAGGNSLVSGQGFISTDNVGNFIRYLDSLGVRFVGRERWAESFARVPDYLADYDVALMLTGRGGDFRDLPGADSVLRWRGPSRPSVNAVRLIQDAAISAGAVVHYASRATEMQRDTGTRIVLTYMQGNGVNVARARHGLILATGGSAASQSKRWIASVGTPYALGDGPHLAAQLGAVPTRNRFACGPYYGFRIPGTSLGVTPWPLYGGALQEGRPRFISRRTGEVIETPETRLHGLRQSPNGTYYRQELEPATMLVFEDELARGPLVRRWPDGHAEGWGRRFFRPWSSTNEQELKEGWVAPLPPETRRMVHSDGGEVLGIPVGPVVLNSLGGLECDADQRVMGSQDPIAGLYAAGELASRFRDRYQGSANLSESVIAGRQAVDSALGRKGGVR